MSVLATHLLPEHGFSKLSKEFIITLKGLGVKGDRHVGKTAQQIYNMKVDKMKGISPNPNLHQVYLFQSELFNEEQYCGSDGERLRPGQMAENITTAGIDLLMLSKGTRLLFRNVEEDRIRKPRLIFYD